MLWLSSNLPKQLSKGTNLMSLGKIKSCVTKHGHADHSARKHIGLKSKREIVWGSKSAIGWESHKRVIFHFRVLRKAFSESKCAWKTDRQTDKINSAAAEYLRMRLCPFCRCCSTTYTRPYSRRRERITKATYNPTMYAPRRFVMSHLLM